MPKETIDVQAHLQVLCHLGQHHIEDRGVVSEPQPLSQPPIHLAAVHHLQPTSTVIDQHTLQLLIPYVAG